jgi:hypothetical protein
MKLERLLEGVLNFFHADTVNLVPYLIDGFNPELDDWNEPFCMFLELMRLYTIHKIYVIWHQENVKKYIGYISYDHDDGWILCPSLSSL